MSDYIKTLENRISYLEDQNRILNSDVAYYRQCIYREITVTHSSLLESTSKFDGSFHLFQQDYPGDYLSIFNDVKRIFESPNLRVGDYIEIAYGKPSVMGYKKIWGVTFICKGGSWVHGGTYLSHGKSFLPDNYNAKVNLEDISNFIHCKYIDRVQLMA